MFELSGIWCVLKVVWGGIAGFLLVVLVGEGFYRFYWGLGLGPFWGFCWRWGVGGWGREHVAAGYAAHDVVVHCEDVVIHGELAG